MKPPVYVSEESTRSSKSRRIRLDNLSSTERYRENYDKIVWDKDVFTEDEEGDILLPFAEELRDEWDVDIPF